MTPPTSNPTKPSRKLDYSEGVTLKEYFEARFEAMDKALALSQEALSSRLEHINDGIEELKKYKATMEGKASQSSVTVAYLVSAIGILIAIIGLFAH